MVDTGVSDETGSEKEWVISRYWNLSNGKISTKDI